MRENGVSSQAVTLLLKTVIQTTKGEENKDHKGEIILNNFKCTSEN